ncbi:hypothetical protein GE107_20215 [Cohnella sp. CFH 77786]|uniref:hypothetical protein n=1 Tax=Cohnella sp. CFH 77786 TaxID=2662265 RepID=UPI001C610C3F|nr:hypothetical protein [Cohnella sp. CFH 77786]MBW5448372.1 hypothetical protein [Cohnella sp. CFH 77786]
MAAEGKRIHVKGVRVSDDGRCVAYEIDYGNRVGSYFSGEPFQVQYDRNVGEVPASVLFIPLLSNLCPVAWVTGADVYVEELDRAFYHSLQKVRDAFSVLYPKLHFKGRLNVGRLVHNRSPQQHLGRNALFFSGGVDSLAACLRKTAERPYLITVWGADIGIGQPHVWEQVKENHSVFGEAFGMENLFLKSNLRTFIHEARMADEFGRITRGWWPGIQHGIGMIGLSAPLGYLLGFRHLFLASSLPPKLAQTVPYGSHATVDNQIRFADTSVRSEGEELSRQDKMTVIADYIRESGTGLQIRVCWANNEYGNCCRCEKCARTAAGLQAEGIDPRLCGFPEAERLIEFTRQNLPSWLAQNRIWVEYWDEIRRRSLSNRDRIRSEDRPFLEWLQSIDPYSHKQKRSARDVFLDLLPHALYIWLKKTVENYRTC